jgi:DNA-binding beta-propeller fold protein YncE
LIQRNEFDVEYTSKFVISSRALNLLFVITLIVGGFIFLFIPNNVQTANVLYVFQRMWGTDGTGNGQFESPSGVAVAASGNVFVVDYGNNRIQQFTNTVTFTRAWEISGNPQAISSLMNLMILNL